MTIILMSFLFRFSRYITVPILMDWLTVHDLVYLESSCNIKDSQTFRSWMIQFHGILRTESIPSVLSLYSGLLPWAARFNFNVSECLFLLDDTTSKFQISTENLKPKYKINVRKIVINSSINWKALARSFAPVVDLENLTEFYFESGQPEILLIVASASKRLRRCFISQIRIKEDIISLLCRNCPGLTHLSFGKECSPIPRAAVHSIIVHARKLQYLTVIPSQHKQEWFMFALHCKSSIETLICSEMGHNSSVRTLLMYLGQHLKTLSLPNPNYSKIYVSMNIHDYCPNLTCLDMASCCVDSAASLVDLLYNLPLLTSFAVKKNHELTEMDFVVIVEQCRAIRVWGGIEDGVRLSTESIEIITSKLTSLTVLNLISKQLTDECVLSIARNCKLLQELYLRNNSELTDGSIVVLAQSCTKLKVLDLNLFSSESKGFAGVSDISAKEISMHCQDLIMLTMMNCCITDLGAVLLCELPSILKLILNVNKISEAVMRAVVGKNILNERKFNRYQLAQKYCVDM